MKPGLLKWIFLALLAVIWGSSFILMKRGLLYFPSDQVAAMRMVIAFIVTFPFVARHYKLIDKGKMKYIAIVGIVGSGIPEIGRAHV